MNKSIVTAIIFGFISCMSSWQVLRAQDSTLNDPKLSIKRIFLVILENEDYQDVMPMPFLGKLARRGAVMQNFLAITHPSQPNYIALISGSTDGVSDDSSVNLRRDHLGNLLEKVGKKWKVYAESFPGNCDLRQSIGTYARKHNPFISFLDVQRAPRKCANIVNSQKLDQDIASGNLAEFSLYVPDLNNDGHDTGVEYSDKFMSAKFGPLLEDPRFMKDTLFVVTYDEGSLFGANKVYTVFYGDHVIPGMAVKTSYNHYDLLRTMEDILVTGTLGLNDERAKTIEGIWK